MHRAGWGVVAATLLALALVLALSPGHSSKRASREPTEEVGQDVRSVPKAAPSVATPPLDSPAEGHAEIVREDSEQRKTEVRLRIRDGRTGDPVATALSYEVQEVPGARGEEVPHDGARELTFEGGSRGGGTDEIALTLTPGARVRVSVKAEGYRPCEGLELVAGPAPGPHALDVRLAPDEGAYATFNLAIHDETGAPVTVLMISRAMSARRHHSPDGRYELNMPAGSHRIELSAPSDQVLLYKREWIPSMHNPDLFPPAHVWLPRTIRVALERGERKTREVAMRRAALIWIQEKPKGAFSDVIVFGEDRLVVPPPRRLYEQKGLVAVVAPGTYTVEGSTGRHTKRRVQVRAEAAEVAEVVLDAGSEARDR